VLAAIATERPARLTLTPTMLQILLDHPSAAATDFGAASILRPQEHDLNDEARLQSCGRPLPLIEFKIVDANGDLVARHVDTQCDVPPFAVTPRFDQPDLSLQISYGRIPCQGTTKRVIAIYV
jgi:hypothetical protein